jgi:peptidoglycan/xylan/chitin deacetylase (PgdA/CDA1 family)
MNDDPTPRHRIYRELHQLLRPLAGEDRESLLAMLRSQIRDSAVSRPLYRALTRDEICQLAEGGLVEVGAHAVTHPVLSSQTAEIQRWEIKESKKMLEAILGQEITAFSYPYGSISDGGKEAIHLVQEAGFKSACTNTPGIVTLSSHPFWLPRFLIRDWDGEGFKRQLSLFFGS